jgi:hypothetical protein
MPGPAAPPLPSADVTAAAEDDKPLPADDAFFAALRSALDDDEPLGPREDAPVREAVAGVFDQDPGAADRSASRFRRRR